VDLNADVGEEIVADQVGVLSVIAGYAIRAW